MLSSVEKLVRDDFTSFVRKVFREEHDGLKLGKEKYLSYLCHELEQVAGGDTRRLVINLPPRHLKTFLGAICLPAWVLAKNPSARIMVITYSEQLAELITYSVRRVLRSGWFKDIFKVRVAKDRAKAGDFATTNGGGVFATSVGGALAGRGADLIIFDDPLDLKDAGNDRQIDIVNQRFDSAIMSRLNNPKTGRVVIIAHRLNDKDLSAHVRELGGWRHIALPLVATRTRKYDLGYENWVRKPGVLLRPGSHTAKQLRHLQANTINPDFELFYQQGRGGGTRLAIKERHFTSVEATPPLRLPVILSVDPSQRGGPANSYCVIQAWNPCGGYHFLQVQWREQCNFERLKQVYWNFVKSLRPSVVLIEATANGPALISDAKRRQSPSVIEVIPDGRSKAARLLEHVPLIRRHGIRLPEAANWRAAYVEELVEFPSSPFDDQVDATTQYLDWISKNGVPTLPPERAIARGVTAHGLPIVGGKGIAMEARGIVTVRRRW
jgi:predicted phage terminase large subunit-like protein